ncbi:hypothetical protein LTR53_018617 [Teratosphaeriaceae sp. CCFEE 6253]|nr:hypothetical protein LTR53_018617 [Teratosphaeriaceae sp. CCFEE 6253]
MQQVQASSHVATDAELLMVGPSATTFRIGNAVIKIPRFDDEAEITQANAKAMRIEANVYRILEAHDRIAYNGTLKDYVATHGPTYLRKWTQQMIEGVEFIHSRGVRHSDIRLNQWFPDPGMNARLSDFNASGYDDHPDLGLPGREGSRA